MGRSGRLPGVGCSALLGSAPALLLPGYSSQKPPTLMLVVTVRSSIDAMAELAERLTASGAETVVIISPHAPLDPAAFVAYEGPQLYGDFANFRAPTATALPVVFQDTATRFDQAPADARHSRAAAVHRVKSRPKSRPK